MFGVVAWMDCLFEICEQRHDPIEELPVPVVSVPRSTSITLTSLLGSNGRFRSLSKLIYIFIRHHKALLIVRTNSAHKKPPSHDHQSFGKVVSIVVAFSMNQCESVPVSEKVS